MGRDFSRTLVWIMLAFALFMLWDAWQVQNGGTSYFAESTTESTQTAQPETAQPEGPALGTGNVNISAPVVVKTDLFELTFDAVGATVARAELLQEQATLDWKNKGVPSIFFGEAEGDPGHVVLLDTRADHIYKAESGLVGGAFPTHRTKFTLASRDLTFKEGSDSLDVVFTASAGNVDLIKTYTIRKGHYGIAVKHEIVNKSNTTINPAVYMQLVRDDTPVANDGSMYNTFTGPALYTEEEKFQKIEFKDIADGEKDYPSFAQEGWVAMIQHYFLSAWVPQEGVKRELYTRQLDKNLFSIGTIVKAGEIAPGAKAAVESQLYVGPQDQKRLDMVAPHLDLVVDYGWLTFLAKPIYYLLDFLHSFVGNWGWAIVLLTCIVKLILYPISAASYKSMARMREVQPRMKALQEKFGNDKQALNQAMMQLYKTEKINPAGGCLPIFLQLPVFLALYWVLLATVELRGAEWMLWIVDLSNPDSYLILPLLMVASMVLQMKISPQPADPTQAKLMMFMPIVFGLMFFFFASGLVLYWLTNNILSIWQQWYVNKQIEAQSQKRRQAG